MRDYFFYMLASPRIRLIEKANSGWNDLAERLV